MEPVGLDLALLVFEHTRGAENAYSRAPREVEGGVVTEHSGPQLRGALFDEVRKEVPERSSAVILLAPVEHVDAMVSALEPQGGRLVRHHLTPEATQALQAAVAESPSVGQST